MSSFSATSTPEKDDSVMMEAPPDSPPELSQSSPSFQIPSSQQANSSQSRTNGESNSKANFGAPGSSWNTKKFQEDYERAESQLIDKTWDHTRFGDPLYRSS